VCKPVLRTAQVDGPGGVDNAFGQSVLPVFDWFLNPQTWAACLFQPSTCVPPPMTQWLDDVDNAAIAAGAFTLQIQTTGLDVTKDQTATNLAAQIFTSGAAASPPKFDTSTDWPVLSDSLLAPQSIANGAKARFASAYVVGGTFVAGTNEHVTVP